MSPDFVGSMSRLSAREQLSAAEQHVQECEDRYRPFARKLIEPGGPHEAPAAKLRKELEAARERLESLRFMFIDHAPKVVSHVERLRQLNQRNAEFWRRSDE